MIGRVRSAGYGFTVRRNIALAKLPAELEEGAEVAVDVFGELVPAVVARGLRSTTPTTCASVPETRRSFRHG